jgi:REP element-mobilizing transposase RayT
MSHTYTSTLAHCVFSTKGRKPLIHDELRPALWAYMGGIARKNKMKALAVGGTSDHVHLLLLVPADLSLSKALQLIKGGSSKWAHERVPEFAWQEGYGAFSVGLSQVPATIAYINDQERHHRKVTFMQEFIAFLKKHNLEYDERYVFG